jgi:hypothetical protein
VYPLGQIKKLNSVKNLILVKNMLSKQLLTFECKLHGILSSLPISAKRISDCFLPNMLTLGIPNDL